jgi:hypothetical protein
MKMDLLHRLVRSLDVGEQRLCEQHLNTSSGHSAALRKAMFEVLLRQEVYDHEALLRVLKGRWSAPRLSQEKQKLYHDLIEMVARLHREREGRLCPWTSWQDARTLLRLGMADAAAETALNGLEQATAQEDVFAELQLRELLREILKETDRKAQQGTILTNDQQLETAVSKARDLTAYTLIHDRMLDYIKKHRLAEAEAVRRQVDDMMRLPEMQGPEQATSLPAQLRYYTIRSMYSKLRNDHVGGLDAYRQVVRLWESNAPRRTQQPHLYRKALANLIGMLTVSGHLEEARQLLARMEAIPLLYQRDRVMHFCDVEYQHQLFYLNVGELDMALQREEGIMKGLREYGRLIIPLFQVSFRYNLAVAHLLNDHPGPAKRLFNEIRDMNEVNECQDLQGLARLFRLVLLLHDPSFENYLRNSRPFFKKEDRPYLLEQLVYTWIGQHWKLTEADAVQQSFVQLSAALPALEQKRITGAEEFRIWAQAHAEGVKVRAVYGRRFTEGQSQLQAH